MPYKNNRRKNHVATYKMCTFRSDFSLAKITEDESILQDRGIYVWFPVALLDFFDRVTPQT